MSTETLDERMMHIALDGWRINVKTHYYGRYDSAEDQHPSKYGHWQITGHQGEIAYTTGFQIDLIPWPFKAKLGYQYSMGGVYATLRDCLDEAETKIDHQNVRVKA